METIKLSLVRPAKKSGGDRYEGRTKIGEDVTIYIPQSISRIKGETTKTINITFKKEEK